MVETTLITTSWRISLTVQKVMVRFSLNVTMCLLVQLMGSWHPSVLECQRWSNRNYSTAPLNLVPLQLFCQVHNVSCKSAREISGTWETKHFWERPMILSVFSWNVPFYLEGETLQEVVTCRNTLSGPFCKFVKQLFSFLVSRDSKIWR